MNTNASGTGPYIFVPDAGQCSDTLVEQIQVNAAISPIFANFGPYCLGDVAVFAVPVPTAFREPGIRPF